LGKGTDSGYGVSAKTEAAASEIAAQAKVHDSIMDFLLYGRHGSLERQAKQGKGHPERAERKRRQEGPIRRV
jgi:hypothetical protein